MASFESESEHLISAGYLYIPPDFDDGYEAIGDKFRVRIPQNFISWCESYLENVLSSDRLCSSKPIPDELELTVTPADAKTTPAPTLIKPIWKRLYFYKPTFSANFLYKVELRIVLFYNPSAPGAHLEGEASINFYLPKFLELTDICKAYTKGSSE